MFFVFNKRKIGSYLISIGTVAILFSIALFGEHLGNGEKNVPASAEKIRRRVCPYSENRA